MQKERKKVKPTYEDATLMIQLAQLGVNWGIQGATNWLWSDQYIYEYENFIEKYPPGSEGLSNATKICGWFENIGTLYKQGLFNEVLLFDWLAVSPVWERIKGFALGRREHSGNTRIYENFEVLAKAYQG